MHRNRHYGVSLYPWVFILTMVCPDDASAPTPIVAVSPALSVSLNPVIKEKSSKIHLLSLKLKQAARRLINVSKRARNTMQEIQKYYREKKPVKLPRQVFWKKGEISLEYIKIHDP